jgi:pyridoxamine 5'-phosphate oxidase
MSAHSNKASTGLSKSDLHPDPLEQFSRWFNEAKAAGIVEPETMVLATVSPEGRPSARAVLLKGFDREGFRFFTNHLSRKGRHISQNQWVALTFIWHPLERQVRIEGTAELVPRRESEIYFRQRPRGSQISALISPQSQSVPDRKYLEDLKARRTLELSHHSVPLPENWGGYVVRPHMIEFWQGRPDRLHDRIEYRFEKDSWRKERLAP